MQTWEAITSRRNVRVFADRPIAAADLDQILEAGRRSPSSQNWQPWDFILVTDRGQLRDWRGSGGGPATWPARRRPSWSSAPPRITSSTGRSST